MATFIVNGSTVTVEKNQKLIRFLRDELHLTSVKDGCSEGACGTCHVLIDGKPTKACIPQTDKLEGKTIITVEGLSDWEKEVFTFAFGEAGAVQCGFCIPGSRAGGHAGGADYSGTGGGLHCMRAEKQRSGQRHCVCNEDGGRNRKSGDSGAFAGCPL